MKTAGKVLLDTNVVVAHFRNDPDLIARLADVAALYLPWVVLGELHFGAQRSQQREEAVAQIHDFLSIAAANACYRPQPCCGMICSYPGGR